MVNHTAGVTIGLVVVAVMDGAMFSTIVELWLVPRAVGVAISGVGVRITIVEEGGILVGVVTRAMDD